MPQHGRKPVYQRSSPGFATLSRPTYPCICPSNICFYDRSLTAPCCCSTRKDLGRELRRLKPKPVLRRRVATNPEDVVIMEELLKDAEEYLIKKPFDEMTELEKIASDDVFAKLFDFE